jgi:antitoxin (DNA-binding transcriptional repressor) of toxin-antitoxin stability system
METVTTHQVKTELARLLAAVEKGGEFVIAKGKRPVAKLVPVDSIEPRPRPKVGEILGEPFEVPDDAFSPETDRELWRSTLQTSSLARISSAPPASANPCKSLTRYNGRPFTSI